MLAPSLYLSCLSPGFLAVNCATARRVKSFGSDFTSVPLNPLEWEGWLDELFDKMRYPNSDLEPAGLIDDVMFVLPWIKQEQYSRMLKMLESWGIASIHQSTPKRN